LQNICAPEYLRTYPPEISEQTFTNLFIWQPSRPILYAEIDNSLVFLVNAALEKGKYILFGPPAGEISIPEVFSSVKSVSRKFSLLLERTLSGLSAFPILLLKTFPLTAL
jgi:hypothetical protein